ncbi:DEP domain-containing protein 1B isoform X1 [Crotalus tigris]|nr:DEP domain-containing protein 1B isoform X1 [Crotalus tigris]
MEPRLVGPGPYRATRLWNETVELFRNGMPLRKHRFHFKSYDCCFTASEAVEWLHKLLRCNQNFSPEVTRAQTAQLLKKFLKNHVIEDIKGRWGKDDFEDNGKLYRFPPFSPLKPYPKRSPYRKEIVKFPNWDVEKITFQDHVPVKPITLNSEMWFKRHSIAIGEVPTCKLIHRRQLTETNVEDIWKSRTLSYLQKTLGLDSLNDILDTKLVNPKDIIQNVYSVNKQGTVILEDKSKEVPHWVLSAMKCLANWPRCPDMKQPTYSGFERDVFRTIADYYAHMKEPLLTFQFFDVFVSVLGILQEKKLATEALQICCLLLPPANRRKLQLLMTLMAKIQSNKDLPPLSDTLGTRAMMVQTFSHCILCSKDEVDLDELLAAKLVSFMMDNYHEILNVPSALKTAAEEYIAHLQRVQVKYPDSDTDAILPVPSFGHQISTDEFEHQKTNCHQGPLANLLEEITMNMEMSIKEKKKKLKQFQKSYPDVYKERFPTPESEAVLFPEKSKQKPLLMWAFKRPFQPFQRTRSLRM